MADTVIVNTEEVQVKTLRDLSKANRTLCKYGTEAYDKGNFAYAVEMFRRILKKEPMAMDIREKLHDAQFQAVKGKPGFLNVLAASCLAPIYEMSLSGLAAKGKHGEAMDKGEHCMTLAPTTAASAMLVAKAAENGGMYPVGKMVLEFSMKFNKKNISLIEYLAFFYKQVNEGKNYLRMYQVLANLQPNNQKWQEAKMRAAALATMEEGGLNKAEQGDASVMDVVKDKDQVAALEQQGRTHATAEGREKLIDGMLTLLETQDSTANRIKLAGLYEDDEQFDKAIEWYEKAIEMTGVEDPTIRQNITKIEVKKVQGQIKVVEAQVQAGELDQAAADEKINALEWQIHDIRKSGADAILRRFPNNHDLRFELAELLAAEDDFDAALPHFQKIQSNPRYRIRASMFVGNCFQGKGVFDLAKDQYNIVIKESTIMDDIKIEAYYQLGLCLKKLGNEEEAMECFKEIYQVDVNYKDVQDLVLGNR